MIPKVVTIGGGNGQSNLLHALHTYFKKQIDISSIVSMSDDGRTTGRLMKLFQDQLGKHLPPPGDLRRCLFMMSNSPKKDEFQQYLETTIEQDFSIDHLTILEYFQLVGAQESFILYLKGYDSKIWDSILPIASSVKGHKVGNLVMANLFHALDDYHKMLDLMHQILQVGAHIIPVTTKKAYIKAILGNGQVIETQDRISNVAAYTSGIADLQLMEDSKHAYQHKDVFAAIKKADYIIISPGDLFTSIISNFVIGGVKEVIGKTDAKIIYIGNSTNKGGETSGLTYLDFVNKIEGFLGRSVDVCIANSQKIELSPEERERFQSHISIKGGDFLYLSEGEKAELHRKGTRYIEADLLDPTTLYKHDPQKLVRVLEMLI